MATVEVFTVGGGEYIVNVFNAVAAWTGQGGYKSLLQVVLVMGFTMSCLVLAFNSDWRAWINWFLQGTLMYMCLMVPRVDVQVVDRVNPSLAPSYVANVPLGLGLVASFTSQVGDYLTRSAEVVFGMPNDMQYSTNGMVYGARLIDASQGLRINDPEFATNLDEHIRNCVFYDILLGHKTMTSIANSGDLWTFLGPGSPARAQKYITDDITSSTQTTDIVTCQVAYQRLSLAWAQAEGRSAVWLGKNLYQGIDSVVLARVYADLGSAYSFLTGVSQDGSSTLKQTLLLNAFNQSIHTMNATGGGSAVDVYAQTRAEIQTKNTYNSIGAAAQKWVPLLQIVLTVMFYALFPVLFPLFLLPRGGVTALKGYVTGFFYLAAWGPLFAILHMMLMFKGVHDLSGAAGMPDNGSTPTLFNYNPIGEAAGDIGMLAGYMMASIPFIAGGIARGAMAISSNATSFLQPSQNAAEVAANEASTGNIALGNSSFDNQNINNRQANNWSDLASYSSGASVFNTRGNDGYTTHSYPGAEVGDASGAISRLAVTPTLTQDLQSTFTTQASTSKARAETLSNTASESLSTASTQGSELRKSLAHTVANNSEIGADTRESIVTGLSAQQQLSQRLQDTAHFTKSEADSASTGLFLTGQADLGFKAPLGGLTGVSGGVSGSAGARHNSTHSTTATGSADYAKGNEILASASKSANFNDQRDSFNRAIRSTGDASVTSRADSATQSYTQAATTSREARQSYEQSQRFEQSAALRRGAGLSVTTADSQEFANFANKDIAAQRAGGHTPAWRGPSTELAVSPAQLAEQTALVQKFVAFKEAQIAAGVEPSLVVPTAGSIVAPSRSSQSKIHPPLSVVGSGGLPAATGPGGGSLDAARALVASDSAAARRETQPILARGERDLRGETAGITRNPGTTLDRNGDRGAAHAIDDGAAWIAEKLK